MPAMLKTRPDHPTSEARSAIQTTKRPALLICGQRAKAKVLTNAGIKYEAIESVAASGFLTPPLRCGVVAAVPPVSRLPPPLGSPKHHPLRRNVQVNPLRGYPFGLCGMTSLRSVSREAAVAARQCSTTISFGVFRNQS